ncbi:radical SAM protein, partial [bacterium]|nr:radical SAM protein [bacterium]
MSFGLYIHIPFCKNKCFYCDFGSVDCSSRGAGYTKLINQYLEALKEEIKYYSGKTIRTIYIGGGTPTIVEGEKIARLLDFCWCNFEVDADAEVSIEANPGTLDKTKLKLLKEAGVNRLSIGVQSFNDRLLKDIGRIHTVSDFLDNFYLARKIGFDN